MIATRVSCLCVLLLAHGFFAAWPLFADEPQSDLAALHLSVRNNDGPPQQLLDPLLREIVRQAFLIAARDELQIPTRDTMLGERLPAGLNPGQLPFSLSSLILGESKTPLDANSADLKIYAAGGEPVWQQAFELAPQHFIEQLAARCEELSRTTFPKLLAADNSSKAKQAETDLPVAEAVLQQLDQMEIVGQFAAIRAMHDSIRRDGHSRQRLGALVRGYANLGALTNCLVGPAHKVFTARSLLYAERLCVADNQSRWALWNRAYARALAGLHEAAIKDLKAAKKAADDSTPVPEWVGVIDTFCRFDEAELAKQAERNQLAAVLRLYSVAFCYRNDVVLATAQGLLGRCPDCYFAIDAIYDTQSLGASRQAADMGPQAAAQWLSTRLSQLDGAPAALAAVAAPRPARRGRREVFDKEGIDSRLRLIQGLRAAGSIEADRGEPSWSALAAIVEDVTFLHVIETNRLLCRQAVGARRRTAGIAASLGRRSSVPRVHRRKEQRHAAAA